MRSPRVVAPRVTTGPILLTDLAVRATCRGGMTLRTGTSQSGVVHRYYTCSTCACKGKSACKGRSIQMDKLDGLVTDQLVERLFHPERLAGILSALTARRAEKAESVNQRIMGLQREVSDAEDKLERLYRLVEDGITDLERSSTTGQSNSKPSGTAQRRRLKPPSIRLLREFALILRSLSGSAIACETVATMEPIVAGYVATRWKIAGAFALAPPSSRVLGRVGVRAAISARKRHFAHPRCHGNGFRIDFFFTEPPWGSLWNTGTHG